MKKPDPKPLKDFVEHGGTNDGADASSADTKSLTATTTGSKLKILCTRITELEMWGTISKIRAKRDREYYEGRLGRNPVGRQVGSGVDLSHYLDRIERMIEDGDADDFGAAVRMVAKEEGLEPDTNRWDSFIRSLQRAHKSK